MKITTKEVSEKFGVYVNTIVQLGGKQLFIVPEGSNPILVSYLTVVGRSRKGFWYLTTKKHSQTTTQQLNQFAKERSTFVIWVDDIDNIGKGETL